MIFHVFFKEARLKNQALLEEISLMKKAEVTESEHLINMKFVEENFQVIELLER